MAMADDREPESGASRRVDENVGTLYRVTWEDGTAAMVTEAVMEEIRIDQVGGLGKIVAIVPEEPRISTPVVSSCVRHEASSTMVAWRRRWGIGRADGIQLVLRDRASAAVICPNGARSMVEALVAGDGPLASRD